ncbi:MAG: PAS domain-containing protein, partial [Acidobacteria bacterium]|nr:PAS domain-containing protein [Acidobacteriota bacterium]
MLVAGLGVSVVLALPKRPWLIELAVVLVGCGVAAAWVAYSVRGELRQLEEAAAKIHAAEDAAVHLRFDDFEGLAYVLAKSSAEVQRRLGDAAESRRELEGLLDSMQDAVIAVDAAGRIQWTNQRMQRLLQPSASTSSVGGSVRLGHALVQTIRDPEVLACVGVALDTRVFCERRTTTLVPGRIFEVNSSPMPGGGAVAVLHDVTQMEEMERTQRDFVANVSHELRTPLTSITGYVETLLDHEKELSTTAREFLSTILKNATRMNRLT